MKRIALLIAIVLFCTGSGLGQLASPNTVAQNCGDKSLDVGQPARQYVDQNGGTCISTGSENSPTMNITTGAATSTSFTTIGTRSALVQMLFGTVAGSYTSCTVQGKTSLNGGANWLNIGPAVSVTVSTGAMNLWSIVESPSTTASSTTSPLFGEGTRFAFACSGYGTSAPVTINVISLWAKSGGGAAPGDLITANGFTTPAGTSLPTLIDLHLEGYESGDDPLSVQNYYQRTFTLPLGPAAIYGDFQAVNFVDAVIDLSTDDTDFNYFTANLNRIAVPSSNDKDVYLIGGDTTKIDVQGTGAMQWIYADNLDVNIGGPNKEDLSYNGRLQTVVLGTDISTLHMGDHVLRLDGSSHEVADLVSGFRTYIQAGSAGLVTPSLTGFSFYMLPATSGQDITTAYGFYATDLGAAGVGITNPYYTWFDSRGVGRCREDNTFDMVGQVICVVYNPQVAKYTPGATDYERIVYGQWSANVAEIGPEKGGGGTERALRLIGSALKVKSIAACPMGQTAPIVVNDAGNIVKGSCS